MDIPENKPNLENALQLLIKELEENHLPFLQNILKLVEEQTSAEALEGVLAPNANELVKHFHLIKGGAGFFGYKELSELARKGEMFFRSDAYSKQDADTTSGEFAETVAALRREVDKIRSECGL